MSAPQPLHAVYGARVREQSDADAELLELRRTVQQWRVQMELAGVRSGGQQQRQLLVPSLVCASDTTGDAADTRVEIQSTSASNAAELSRMKNAIETVDFVYIDGSICLTPRSAHRTKFIVGLLSSAVAHAWQSGINQLVHLTRSDALISGPIRPTDFWAVLELIALLPGLHEAAEDERADAVKFSSFLLGTIHVQGLFLRDLHAVINIESSPEVRDT